MISMISTICMILLYIHYILFDMNKMLLCAMEHGISMYSLTLKIMFLLTSQELPNMKVGSGSLPSVALSIHLQY